MSIKVFSDGADPQTILDSANDPNIHGFTTNPSLMRQAGIEDYTGFCKEMLSKITDKPISFEVFADDPAEMKRQALEIAKWGDNVYVKIPIMNSEGQSTAPLIDELSHSNVKINVTAVLTLQQTLEAAKALSGGEPSIVSVFAGRIADAGRDPVPLMQAALAICKSQGNQIELLWASTREVLNILQADQMGCHIITVPPGLLKKRALFGKDLHTYSLETVKTFKSDADNAGYSL